MKEIVELNTRKDGKVNLNGIYFVRNDRVLISKMRYVFTHINRQLRKKVARGRTWLLVA